MSRLPNEDAMERYFSALLDEPKQDAKPAPVAEPRVSFTSRAVSEKPNSELPLQSLLNTISPEQLESKLLTQQVIPEEQGIGVDSLLEEVDSQLTSLVSFGSVLPNELVFAEPEPEPEATIETEVQVELNVAEEDAQSTQWQNIEPEDEFQALFFEVAGISFAVMLTELGGIHKIDNVTSIFGKPAWFSGMMTQREKKLNVVDTAKWVMTDNAPEDVDYKYLILLGDTSWGLSCCNLIGTEKLTKDQVKWRHQEGKRPWLAGMVKKKMCALLHVSELVKLLSRGVNIEGT
ncbi:chemotaxis protein CheW [Motilimonas cestriensis]|uniref:Chemotaxis protein CheW n=1 Tax=Motilimonas cestriensis TaxID=2742685 RepID=A0ABS8WB57_9GAMM|nr:chemotaxis protein CheW [Motilimonas cestriensis]MCE2595532.1 chemotaxis protein CheW [Motilimonas cestriensis]